MLNDLARGLGPRLPYTELSSAERATVRGPEHRGPRNGRANHEDLDLLGVLRSRSAWLVRVHDTIRLVPGRLAHVDAVFLRL
jgi:hypothetical protein